MAILDFPQESRFRSIEDRLIRIEVLLENVATKADMAEIKTRLEAVPSRWMQWLFALAILMPIYGILATLLWTTVHH